MAKRFLVYYKDASRDKIAAAVERGPVPKRGMSPCQFRTLHVLIQLLAGYDGNSADGPLAKLLEKQITGVGVPAAGAACDAESRGPVVAEQGRL